MKLMVRQEKRERVPQCVRKQDIVRNLWDQAPRAQPNEPT